LGKGKKWELAGLAEQKSMSIGEKTKVKGRERAKRGLYPKDLEIFEDSRKISKEALRGGGEFKRRGKGVRRADTFYGEKLRRLEGRANTGREKG